MWILILSHKCLSRHSNELLWRQVSILHMTKHFQTEIEISICDRGCCANVRFTPALVTDRVSVYIWINHTRLLLLSGGTDSFRMQNLYPDLDVYFGMRKIITWTSTNTWSGCTYCLMLIAETEMCVACIYLHVHILVCQYRLIQQILSNSSYSSHN